VGKLTNLKIIKQMKSETEIREILIEVKNYSSEEADDIISNAESGDYEEMKGHILSQTGIDLDDY